MFADAYQIYTQHIYWGNLLHFKLTYQLKMKFAAQSDSNMLNLMLVFTFSFLDWKSFWGKLGKKMSVQAEIW